MRLTLSIFLVILVLRRRQCSRPSFLAIVCLPGFNPIIADNLLRTQTEASTLKSSWSSASSRARPTHFGKVVIELDSNRAGSQKAQVVVLKKSKKTKRLKLKSKKDKGWLAVTLQPLPNRVSKRKSLVAQRKGGQRKRMRKQKHVDYQGDDNKSKANSYISKPEDYPSLESLEYPDDPNIACDPDVQNCKNASELEKERHFNVDTGPRLYFTKPAPKITKTPQRQSMNFSNFCYFFLVSQDALEVMGVSD